MAETVGVWAELLKNAPYIAIIIALGIVAVYLFRRKEKLQTKYTEDLIKATSALQELTAEYLKQAFTNSAAWQDRVKSLESLYQQQTELFKLLRDNEAEGSKHIEKRLEALQQEIKESETRIKDHLGRQRG